MNRTLHKAGRLRTIQSELRESGVLLAWLRREECAHLPPKPRVQEAHAFGLKKTDLEILLVLDAEPGLTSNGVMRRLKLSRRISFVAERLVVLFYQGMVKFRRMKGVRRWYLDTNGDDAIHLLG